MKICPSCELDYEDDVTFCSVDGTRLESKLAPREDRILGTILKDKYRVTARLGAGGMGSVYRAFNMDAEMDVALKVLNFAASKDEYVVARFKREKKIISRLRHPNVLKLLDSFVDEDDQLVIVTELVEGQTLEDRLCLGAMPLSETLFIIREVADALIEAHEQGIIHRDLKPSNLMLEQVGDKLIVKVLDFGIAKDMSDTELTTSGTIGTPAYMSPEQVQGKSLDGRSDLYSLGAIAYECLSGQTVFQGATAFEILRQHLMVPAPALGTLKSVPTIPKEIEDLILSLLSKNANDRPRDGRHLRDTIDELVVHLDGEKSRPPSPIRSIRSDSSNEFRQSGSLNTGPVSGQEDTIFPDADAGHHFDMGQTESPANLQEESASLSFQNKSMVLPVSIMIGLLLAIGIFFMTRDNPSSPGDTETTTARQTSATSTMEKKAKTTHSESKSVVPETPRVTPSPVQPAKSKFWLCNCNLYSDVDKRLVGEWQGRAEGTVLASVQTVSGPNQCESVTQSHEVGCRRCSCKVLGDQQPFGVKINHLKKQTVAGPAGDGALRSGLASPSRLLIVGDSALENGRCNDAIKAYQKWRARAPVDHPSRAKVDSRLKYCLTKMNAAKTPKRSRNTQKRGARRVKPNLNAPKKTAELKPSVNGNEKVRSPGPKKTPVIDLNLFE